MQVQPPADPAVQPNLVSEKFFADERPAVPGLVCEAEVQIPGTVQPLPLRANTVGAFERVIVPLNSRLPFAIHYPKAEVGRKVMVAVQDGGDIEGGKAAQIFTLGEDRMVRFTFATGSSRGRFRVELRLGSDVKNLEVWAGKEVALNQ
jgi:hypothetical protein